MLLAHKLLRSRARTYTLGEQPASRAQALQSRRNTTFGNVSTECVGSPFLSFIFRVSDVVRWFTRPRGALSTVTSAAENRRRYEISWSCHVNSMLLRKCLLHSCRAARMALATQPGICPEAGPQDPRVRLSPRKATSIGHWDRRAAPVQIWKRHVVKVLTGTHVFAWTRLCWVDLYRCFIG